MNVTVVSAKQEKDKGTFIVWQVICKDADGAEIEAEYASKFAPKVGDKGTIESSQYGPKFVPVRYEKRGGGKGSSDSSIEAQVALKAAVEWGSHQTPRPTTDQLVALTKKFADAIRDAKA